MQNQRDSLDEAREAFSAGDYPKALERYEYFFDHALDEDKAALYGVRLSYCLDEWAELGEKYPAAKLRLEAKRDETIAQFHISYDPELFHDYIAICRYLKCKDLPISQFVAIHEDDKSISNQIVRFIWGQLVERRLWEICIEYLPNPIEKYDKCVWKYDEMMAIRKEDPSFGGEDFEEFAGRSYVRDVSNILLVLKNVGDISQFETVLRQAKSDLQLRSGLALFEELQKRIAI